MGGRFIKDTSIMLKKGRDEICMEVVVAVVEGLLLISNLPAKSPC